MVSLLFMCEMFISVKISTYSGSNYYYDDDTEGLMTEFEGVTVSYGIECSFLVIITHECA